MGYYTSRVLNVKIKINACCDHMCVCWVAVWYAVCWWDVWATNSQSNHAKETEKLKEKKKDHSNDNNKIKYKIRTNREEEEKNIHRQIFKFKPEALSLKQIFFLNVDQSINSNNNNKYNRYQDKAADFRYISEIGKTLVQFYSI